MKRKILLSAILVGLAINLPADAKSVALNDLKDYSIDNVKPSDKGKAFDSNHWAYRTLKNVTDKYGVLIGRPGENFDGTRPISRNEAAIILVNLMGKVEDQNIKLNDGEKAKIEILQQELSGEINRLSGRVDAVEKQVVELKGSVSNIEESSKKTWHNLYGEDFKITGGLQAAYTAMPSKGDDGYSPNFGLPYSEIAISGKINKHIDYVAQLVPTRNFSDTNFNGLLRDAYISTDIIPQHKLFAGQMAKPVGREALLSPMGIDFVDYSQASRKLLSNSVSTGVPYNHDVGVMISGSQSFIDYSVGTFNGNGQNAFDSNRRSSIAGQINLKPLFKSPQLGALDIGGSLEHGYNGLSTVDRAGISQNIYGCHASYTYKKLNLKGEYIAKNGFINPGQKARGLVFDTKYNLTDKIQLLARFDKFKPDVLPEDLTLADGNVDAGNTLANLKESTEYVAGVNYLFSDNLLFMVNYVRVSNKFGKDSNRVGFLTQVMF